MEVFMEIKEFENKSSAELFALSDQYRQAALKKEMLELLEQTIPEIEKRVENVYTKQFFSELSGEKAKNIVLGDQIAEIKSKLQNAESQLDADKRELQESEDEKNRLLGRLKQLQNIVDQTEQQQKGFKRACEKKVSDFFPFIETESYEAYVLSLTRENIKLIYSKMRNEYKYRGTDWLKMCEELIGEYIEISHHITGDSSIQWQEIEDNALFEASRFDKVSDAAETGKVTNVVYYGLERNGTPLPGCKSLVEVK